MGSIGLLALGLLNPYKHKIEHHSKGSWNRYIRTYLMVWMYFVRVMMASQQFRPDTLLYPSTCAGCRRSSSSKAGQPYVCTFQLTQSTCTQDLRFEAGLDMHTSHLVVPSVSVLQVYSLSLQSSLSWQRGSAYVDSTFLSQQRVRLTYHFKSIRCLFRDCQINLLSSLSQKV